MKIYISSCEPVRSGEKNGRKWTLYNILTPENVRYSTFEAKYSGMVGQEIDVQVKEDTVTGKNGRQYLNRTIIEPKSQQSSGQSGVIMAKLEAMDKRLTTIIGMLSELEKVDEDVPSLDEGPDGTDIKPDDIGF